MHQPVSSTWETLCTYRRPTLVLTQRGDDSSSTAALPPCHLTPHQSQDITSLKTMGRSGLIYLLEMMKILKCVCGSCLVDAKLGGSNSHFQQRHQANLLRLQMNTFLFEHDPRNSVRPALNCIIQHVEQSTCIHVYSTFLFRYSSRASWKWSLKCGKVIQSTKPVILQIQGIFLCRFLFFFFSNFLFFILRK